MSMVNFLLLNWDSVIIILGAAAGLIVLIARRQYTILDKIIFCLVTEAERKYGGGAGAFKLAAVIEWVYPKIPLIIRLFIAADKLQEIIERVLADAKKRWDSDPTINLYISNYEKFTPRP